VGHNAPCGQVGQNPPNAPCAASLGGAGKSQQRGKLKAHRRQGIRTHWEKYLNKQLDLLCTKVDAYVPLW